MAPRLVRIAAVALVAAGCDHPLAPAAAEAPPAPPPRAIAAPEGIVELWPLPGESDSRPSSVNSSGRVAGTSGGRSVVWENGIPAALELPSGARAIRDEVWINDTGFLAGSVLIDGGSRAVRWEDGHMIPLAPLPGHAENRVTGLSEAGHVSGVSYAETWVDPRWTAGNRAFVWHEGRMTFLPPLPGHDVSLAFDVDSDGVVLGVSVNALREAPRFLIWRDGEIIWAQDGSHPPNAWDFDWVGLSDSGDAFAERETEEEVWRWRDGDFRPYPDEAYYPTEAATAVAPGGLVLGAVNDVTGVWRSEEFAPFDPALVSACMAISDTGYVVCEGPGYTYPFLTTLSGVAAPGSAIPAATVSDLAVTVVSGGTK